MSTLVRPVSGLVRSVRQVSWRPGPDPRSLETFLRDLGYLSPLSRAESGTESGAARISDAIRRFQAAAGLEVDGRPGRPTVHALAQARHALLDARAFAA